MEDWKLKGRVKQSRRNKLGIHIVYTTKANDQESIRLLIKSSILAESFSSY